MDVRRTMLGLAVAALAAGCANGPAPPAAPAEDALAAVAVSYVKLVLAVGRHDALYVDAYYGPPAWKDEVQRGEPVSLSQLLGRTRSLRDDLARAPGPADRKRYLDKQLVAIDGYLRRLSGETMTLTEECRVLYDADPPRHTVAEFAAAHAELERIVPGSGPLGARIEAMRKAAYVPRERIGDALETALVLVRKANAPFVRLPQGENFDTLLVTDKPWGAYNWYLGNFKSRIELNTDLPVEAGGLLGVMAHEGYPGHHLYNVLLEEKLVKGKDWVEYTVYPLYSPQSLLAEGSANVGLDIVFSDDERRRALAGVLAPAAGVPASALLAMDRIRGAMRPLKGVSGEAARMLLDEGAPEAEVVAFLETWGLSDHDRAASTVRFVKTYRSYVFNYSLGEDLVRAWIGTGPGRRDRFYDILSRPMVPSDLVK